MSNPDGIRASLNFYRRRVTNIRQRVATGHQRLDASNTYSTALDKFWSAYDAGSLRDTKHYTELLTSMEADAMRGNVSK